MAGAGVGAALAGSCDGDNQSEVGQSKSATSKELTPLHPTWPQMKKPGHASDDDRSETKGIHFLVLISSARKSGVALAGGTVEDGR